MNKTLNERGACECGNRTFELLEQVVTNVSLALTPAVLEQYGPTEASEIINASCKKCDQVYEVSYLGEIKLKAFAV